MLAFLRDRLVYSLSSFLPGVKITTMPCLLFAAELELSSQSNIDFSEQRKISLERGKWDNCSQHVISAGFGPRNESAAVSL